MPPTAEKKSLALGYALWALGLVGLCGVQRLYLGQTAPGLLYLFTFGLCGVGQLLDLILLPDATKQANLRLNLAESASRATSTSTQGQPSYADQIDAIAAYRLGMDAQAKGNHQEALKHFQQSLQLEDDPKSQAFVHYNVGVSHESLGDQYAALSSYNEAIRLNPNMPHSHNNLAAIHRALGADAAASGNQHLAKEHITRAKHLWRQAISLSPHSFPEAIEWLASSRNHEAKANDISDSQVSQGEQSFSSATQASDFELDELIDQARQSIQRINSSDDT